MPQNYFYINFFSKTNFLLKFVYFYLKLQILYKFKLILSQNVKIVLIYSKFS
jgi:hypothetical protein